MNLLPYKPHPLLRSGHLQTLAVGFRWGELPPYNARSRVIPTRDGEALVVHEELGSPLAAEAPLIILIHGLGGDHTSSYLQRLAPRLRAAGNMVWRIDLRGCGMGAEHASRPAHAGISEDIACVVAHANQTFPSRPIRIIGFSLSGNILLKFLGELATNQLPYPVDGASLQKCLAVAPPVNLRACADNIDRFSRRIYTQFYLDTLTQQVQKMRSRWPRWARLPDSPAIKTIRQFDARYTAPLNGFASTDDYYSRSSASNLSAHIRTPTTVLIDKHDPIVPYASFSDVEFNQETTSVITTERGGHMGYFGVDAEGKNIRWMEYFVLEFCKREP